MSRPKPDVIQEWINKKTFKSEQILKADAIYAVYFDGKPINLRSILTYETDPNPKYKRSSFCSPGHAINLADKLNKLFKTTKFEVYKMEHGAKINPNDYKS